MISIGSLGLHDANFRSLPGGYTLNGAGTVMDASLDLLTAAGTAVHPLADGMVLKTWPACDVVLVDHHSGVWVEYLHLAITVSDDQPVTSATILGTVLPQQAPGWTPPPECGNLESGVPHLHFAFLSGSGTTGTYVSMNDKVLCAHPEDAMGNLVGLGQVSGPPFAVPDCAGGQGPSGSTQSPTPSSPVLGGSWVAPASGATLKTTTLTLSAKPTATLTDVKITKVVYGVAWGSVAAKPACTAAKGASGGTWSCATDLLGLDIPPGGITLSFDVYDDVGDVTHSAGGVRLITYAVPPPKPANTTYTLLSQTPSSDLTTETDKYKATWVEPTGYASKFLVYGVTQCLRASQQNDGTPCVVVGMKIPQSTLVLLGTFAGSAGSGTVTWTRGNGEGPDPYWAILLSASNRYGESRLAILFSGQVCFQCSY